MGFVTRGRRRMKLSDGVGMPSGPAPERRMKSLMSLPALNDPPEPMNTCTAMSGIGFALVERGRHGVIHGAREGVLLRRPREADELDAVAERDVYVVGHRTLPAKSSASVASAPVVTVSLRPGAWVARFSAKKRATAICVAAEPDAPLRAAASAARAR